MCGIVGIAASAPIEARAWVAAGRDAMAHRGPDDCGEWWSPDGCVGLGHRRLSIVDLSAAGHQPMHDDDGSLTIVFNGEIYNSNELRAELISKGHSFRSQSDTEVLLAAYGEWRAECLSRLNGMFAFALFDHAGHSILLARDRAGEKPLFYALSKFELRFASELKGLLADQGFSRRISPEALDCFLAMGYVPGDRCILDGVRKLPPAHALRFDLKTGSSQTWCYWKLPEPASPQAGEVASEDRLLEELETLLDDAVRLQLIADVPVGVLLSGGVDSSLVTAAAARASAHVKTFTVGFPEFGVYDESEHARLIARHFGTEHIELQAGAVHADILLVLARQYDEPIMDSSMIPTYLVSQLVRQHCTVALGGDGADELFGGYPTYDRLLWVEDNLGWMPGLLRAPAAFAAGAALPTGLRGRNWLQALKCDLGRSLPLIASFFDVAERRRLMNASWCTCAERIRSERLPQGEGLLERATRMDFSNYLPEDILVKVDRASMLSSLEVRAPFLDYRIIEFAYGRVPAYLKATASSRKVLLKKLTERMLPASFDRQRKQGFSIPIADWLKRGPWLDLVREVLLDGGCLFDRRAVAGLLHGQRRGRMNGERLLGLTLFELWRREYRVVI